MGGEVESRERIRLINEGLIESSETHKNANAMFSVCPFYLTHSSTFECLVLVISDSDTDVHRIGDLRRLFDVDQTLLDHTPRDKIENI